MHYHPLFTSELARQRQAELAAAAALHRLIASGRRQPRLARARRAIGWALVDLGLRLVTPVSWGDSNVGTEGAQ